MVEPAVSNVEPEGYPILYGRAMTAGPETDIQVRRCVRNRCVSPIPMRAERMSTDHLLLNRFEMRATDSWLHRVDEWRRHQKDMPSRSEAIRRLVEKELSQNG